MDSKPGPMKSIDVLADLNEGQRAAATFDGRHCLVLAGAGTGKTTTIIARVRHLVETGTDPRRILLLTFTRRAASQMKERLTAGVRDAERFKRLMAGTFHYHALATMRRMPAAFGIQGATVIDRDDQVQLMKLARAERVDAKSRIPKAAQLVNYSSYARNTNQPLSDYLEKFTDLDEEMIPVIRQIVGTFGERKRECRYLDYDDLLYVFAATMKAQPTLAAKIAGDFDHVLVDEMQDTNPLQWLILDRLREHSHLFCVGDDAQSIYAFRGADFENVHSFSERVAGSETLKLDENYRSYQPILDLSNWLLDQSPLDYDKHLTSTRGDGPKPAIHNFDSDLDEANWIADDIIDRHEGGAALSEHMVLTRTAFGARALEAALVARDLPYRFIGGTTLLKSAHVKDLLSLLRAVDNPRDQLAWMRYLTLWPRIGDKSAAKWIAELETASSPDELVERLKKRAFDRPALVSAVQSVIANADRPDRAIAAAAEAIDDLMEKQYSNWDLRQKDFRLLERLAASHGSIAGFIETYTLDPMSESEATQNPDEDSLTLITVHSAKGTESPVCYILGAQSGNYPHTRSQGDPDEIEEERRVLYVAMTRAQNELILTRTMRTFGAFTPSWSRYSDGGESTYFLANVPKGLVSEDFASAAYDPDATL